MNAASNTPQEALLNEAQAANYLNVSVRTLQQWRVSGRGPVFTKLSRAVRFRRADLDAFIAKGVAQSTTEANARKRAS
jgi:excisionase family DNA binding protein